MKFSESAHSNPIHPIFTLGTDLVRNGQVFLGLSMTAVGISQSGALAPDSGKARAGAASIFALLDRKSEIDSAESGGMTLENVKGDIEFQHISFRYPSRPDVQIFGDLCLAIHSGKVRLNQVHQR